MQLLYRVCINFFSGFYKIKDEKDLVVRFRTTLNWKIGYSGFVWAKIICNFADVEKIELYTSVLSLFIGTKFTFILEEKQHICSIITLKSSYEASICRGVEQKKTDHSICLNSVFLMWLGHCSKKQNVRKSSSNWSQSTPLKDDTQKNMDIVCVFRMLIWRASLQVWEMS